MNERIKAIIRAKEAQGLTDSQLADMCRLSCSTVSRTFSEKTEPTEYTINAMEEALGITDIPNGEPIQEHIADDPILQRYLNMQEIRINRLRAHYNMLLAGKDRWIRNLFVLSITLVIIICLILIMDLLNPAMGWVRQYSG